eukprot:6282035-Pyramimonas_sp.AAC.1
MAETQRRGLQEYRGWRRQRRSARRRRWRRQRRGGASPEVKDIPLVELSDSDEELAKMKLVVDAIPDSPSPGPLPSSSALPSS